MKVIWLDFMINFMMNINFSNVTVTFCAVRKSSQKETALCIK